MKQITLKIDGMMCGMCESHINDTVRKVFPGAKKVSSSHSKGETIILTEDAFPEDAVRQAIEETGYQLLSVSEKPYEKKGFFSKLFG